MNKATVRLLGDFNHFVSAFAYWNDHNSSGTRFTGSYPLSLGFTLTGVGENIFPTNPDDVSNSNMSVVMDGNVSGSSQQTSKGQVTTWTGTYTINPTISAENDIDGDIALTFGGLTVGESFFYEVQGSNVGNNKGNFVPNPTPTPTPTPSPSASGDLIYVPGK